jgi:hypothetical protein
MGNMDLLVYNELLHVSRVVDHRVEKVKTAEKKKKNFEDLKKDITFPNLLHSTPRLIDLRERKEMRMIKGWGARKIHEDKTGLCRSDLAITKQMR